LRLISSSNIVVLLVINNYLVHNEQRRSGVRGCDYGTINIVGVYWWCAITFSIYPLLSNQRATCGIGIIGAVDKECSMLNNTMGNLVQG
jgi:hypothetical protein